MTTEVKRNCGRFIPTSYTSEEVIFQERHERSLFDFSTEAIAKFSSSSLSRDAIKQEIAKDFSEKFSVSSVNYPHLIYDLASSILWHSLDSKQFA
jgi:hypothetical protein